VYETSRTRVRFKRELVVSPIVGKIGESLFFILFLDFTI